LQDVIAPHFRQNDFYGGLVAGVGAITSLLDKESFPAPGERKPVQAEESNDFSFVWFVVFVILFILLSRLRSARGFHHGRYSWGRSSGIILGGSSFGGFGRDNSGGFSGGGFSGGGGSADGGGASGNW